MISFQKALRKYNPLGLTGVILIRKINTGHLKAFIVGTIRDFKHCYIETSELSHLIENIKEKRISEIGMYREEVMQILKVGENTVVKLDNLGILKPKEIIYFKDGRKRYMYDKDDVFNTLNKAAD